MRAVIDANVFVSALINDRGRPAEVVRAWMRTAFELVISAEILRELRLVFERQRIRDYISASDTEIRAFLADIERSGVDVERTETIDLSDDPDDNRILEATVAGRADYIITGDDDLLRLREVRGTCIRTPAQFLIELAARDEPPT